MTSESVSDGLARGHVLAREVGEFLIELAIALQKHAIYPVGHPALDAVTARVLDRAGALMEQRPSLSLGVARTQLVIEGIATDASHPVLRQLALRFHEHHLATLRFERGLEADELRELLLSLSTESSGAEGEPLGLSDRLPSWPHIKLSALGLEDLEIVSSEEGEGSRASRLWLDLARAALAGERHEKAADEDELSPTIVAHAIDRRSGSGTYDQVIAGYLIEITRTVKSAPGVEATPLVERVGKLVGELRPETLRRLMAHGGDRGQQRTFVEDAAATLPVDAVVQLLTATADAAARPLSEFLLRMYEKLALHAERDAPPAASLAEEELRTQVRELVEGWSLANPNPEAYGRALTAIARSPVTGGAGLEAITPERLLSMCLEMEHPGDSLTRAVDRLVEDGRASAVLDLTEEDASSKAAVAARARLGRIENLPQLLSEAGLEPERVVPLLERMGEPGLRGLLDLLIESEDRGVRRRAFDVLAGLGPVIAPAIDGRLHGETRWFVIRNLLALHDAIETSPARDLEPLTRHQDARVRREALKLMLKDPETRPAALLRILEDPEPRVVQLVRSSEGTVLPPGTVSLLTRRIGDPELPEPLKASLVRLFGWTAESDARDALIGLAVRGRSLLGRLRFEPPTPVGLAALEMLATHWARDPTAADVLDRALAVRDADIRAAAGGAGAAP